MEIKLVKEEIDFITKNLGEVPSKFVYGVIKLIESKVLEVEKQKETEQAEVKE